VIVVEAVVVSAVVINLLLVDEPVGLGKEQDLGMWSWLRMGLV